MSDGFRSPFQAIRDDEDRVIAPDAARKILDMVKDSGGFHAIIEPSSLLDLQALPSTDEVLASLENARQRYTALTANVGRRILEQARKDLEFQEQRYADALRRDAIRHDRPDGCWCLGYGGRHPRNIPISTGEMMRGSDGHDYAAVQEHEVLGLYCDCLEGQMRQARDNALRREYRETRTRRAVIKRFGEARLPLEYRGHPWRSHPDEATVLRVDHWLTSVLQVPDESESHDTCHWLLLYGHGGRGKTTIAAGLAAELAEKGASVLFRPLADLLSDIKATYGKDGETETLRQLLLTVRWLFLDDLGVEIPRDWVGELLWQIFNHRHNEHLPIVMTTNLGADPKKGGLRELGAHLGDRIWGRVKRMAEPIEMSGKDLRDLPHG